MHRSYLKAMILAAFCAALSIVCGKYLAITSDVLRFSFENLPVILAGVLLGPLFGAATGTVADLVGCFLVGYTVNPLVTLGAAAIGLCSGLCFRFLRLALPWRLALTVATAHLIGSVGIKTAGLAAWYSMPFWQLVLWRLLNYAILGVLEGVILFLLLRSKAIQKQVQPLLPASTPRWF